MTKKIAIIGAGHNALVTACYLAKAGHSVEIYEKSADAGGLCINKELWPKYDISLWANWSGMFTPQIAEDLEIELPKILSSEDAILTANGGCVFEDDIYIDNIEQKDRDGLKELEDTYYKLGQALSEQFLAEKPTKKDFLNRSKGLGLSDNVEELLKDPFLKIANQYIPNKELATAIGYESFTHPLHSGSAYGYTHMRVAEIWGKNWGLIKGGMGKIAEVLELKAKALGVKISLNSAIDKIIHNNNNSVQYLLLSNGEKIIADTYISNTDYPTLQNLLNREIMSPMRDHKYGNANIHVKLTSLPSFSALKKNNLPLPATLTLVPTWDEMHTGYNQYLNAENIDHPVISICIPTLADNKRAPKGKHFMCIHPDHAPLGWNKEKWTENTKASYINHILNEVSRYAPDIHACIEDPHLFCSDDLENKFGAMGSHCFHGDLSWQYALDDRMRKFMCSRRDGYRRTRL